MTRGRPIEAESDGTRRVRADGANAPHQPTAVPSTALEAYFATRPWLLALVLVIVTFVAYQPTWRDGFIWDDDHLITDNRMVQARNGLYRIWFTTEAMDYYPITSSFWWVQWRLWGKNAVGYHAVNVLLHAANVILVWLVLQRLRIPGAWLAALLFAVHPVNVTTVAWISEQKNTLSMLFFALSILWYLRFDEKNERCRYGLSLAAFLLALLSKTAVVMLPVVLLGCIWWLRGRIQLRDWLRATPFFALSILLGLTTVWFEYNRDLNGRLVRTGGLFSHLPVAGVAPWFYLSKAILPLNLCMIYPQWDPGTWGWSGWLPGIALAGSVAFLWRKRHGWGRPLLFGLGYFVVMLFPVLGFFDQAFYECSMVADHWQYYSIVGITALAAAGAVALGAHLHRGRQAIGLATGVVVIALGALTWQRCLVFHDRITLFQEDLIHNPLAYVAHNNLGVALVEQGRVHEGIEHYEAALRIKPDYASPHNNLGAALVGQGRVQEGIAQYETALRMRPDDTKARCNLGVALVGQGRMREGIEQYETALRIEPDYAEARDDLGSALLILGKVPEAIEQYQQALKSNPDFAVTRIGLANALFRQGRVDEAIACYTEALRIQPDSAEAHNNLGAALIRLGKREDAIAHYENAVRLKPDYADAHYNLGMALEQAGRLQDAIGHYEQAVRIKPDFTRAQNALARLQARQ